MGEGSEIAGMTAPANAWAVTGQRVLITGASSGLGLAMARALAEGGARVVLGGRDEGRLAEALRSLAPWRTRGPCRWTCATAPRSRELSRRSRRRGAAWMC